MKLKNYQILSHGVRSVFVRNLSTGTSSLGLEGSPPSPSIQISAVNRTDNQEILLFHGKSVALTCNPSWNALEFESDVFTSHPNLTGNQFHISFDKITDIRVQIFDCNPTTPNGNLLYDLLIDIKRMVWLPHLDIATISSLPLNSVFFFIEDGGAMIDEKLYITLRSSGIISVGNKSNRMDNVSVEEDESEDPHMEEQALKRLSLQSILKEKEMNISSLRETTQQQLISSGSAHSVAYTKHIKLTTRQLLKLKLHFEEKIFQYELRCEESERERMNEMIEEIREKVKEVKECQVSVDNMTEIIEEKKEELLKTNFILEARQLKLLGELGTTIYPIESVPVSSSPVTGNVPGSLPEEYMIRGIELPMIIDTSLKDDEQISTALGYVVHLVALASKYLQIPLRYEVIYNSSRSMIRDPVVGRGGALPLFKRGVERDRFDRALQWLQKDIEQLLLIRSGTSYDKKKSILGNLKQLFACEDCLKMIS